MPIHQLSDIEETEIVPGYRARFIHSENMTVAYWTIETGAALPEHSHPHEQITNILSGEFELIIEGQTNQLASGAVIVIPANVVHSGKALSDCRLLDVFYPVRQDYLGSNIQG